MTTIGILECGQTRSDWIAQHGEMADPFPPFLRRADPTLRFEVFKAHRDQLPASASQCDAWLVTGSPHSVHQPEPWQPALAAFLVQAALQRPVVGICYGHQLMHQALGGEVACAPQGWGVGVHQYAVQALPAWVAGDMPAQPLRLIALHQDQVLRAAPGTRVLAGNDFCPLSITTIGDNVLTVQPHPEMTRVLARDIYEEARSALGDALADPAIASLDGPLDDALVARWILAFIAHRRAALGSATTLSSTTP
jgi:GMP synthase-like glutamine amidotransferase